MNLCIHDGNSIMKIKNLDLLSLLEIINVKYISDDLRNEVELEIKRREK